MGWFVPSLQGGKSYVLIGLRWKDEFYHRCMDIAQSQDVCSLHGTSGVQRCATKPGYYRSCKSEYWLTETHGRMRWIDLVTHWSGACHSVCSHAGGVPTVWQDTQHDMRQCIKQWCYDQWAGNMCTCIPGPPKSHPVFSSCCEPNCEVPYMTIRCRKERGWPHTWMKPKYHGISTC